MTFEAFQRIQARRDFLRNGAGGLGMQIELSMRMFQFDEVFTLLAILFVLVAAVDWVSGRIRQWIV